MRNEEVNSHLVFVISQFSHCLAHVRDTNQRTRCKSEFAFPISLFPYFPIPRRAKLTFRQSASCRPLAGTPFATGFSASAGGDSILSFSQPASAGFRLAFRLARAPGLKAEPKRAEARSGGL